MAADAHLVTLRPRFAGIVLPSKIYACLASRRPIMFVGPQSSDVHLLCLESGDPSYRHVDPGDTAAFAAALEQLAGCGGTASRGSPDNLRTASEPARSGATGARAAAE